MKTFLKILLAVIVLGGLGAGIYYVIKSNKKEIIEWETQKPTRIDITKSVLATGTINPKEEIEIKPNISGIIDRLYVKEGQKIGNGEMIATVKVVPNVNSLNAAKQSIRLAEINLENENRNYQRQKKLLDQGVISRAEYEVALATYNTARQNVTNANSEYRVALSGVAPGLEKYATTQIRSTISGVVLDIPIKIGDNVQEINNFSVGTTICNIADLSNMIFEGKVDEAEAGKLKVGMPLKITVGALPGETFDANLTFISPKGIEEAGTVKFEIEAEVQLKQDQFIRAGYSANGEVQLKTRKDILAIDEALVQYDKDQAFVEIKQADGEFKKKNVSLGVSDGLYIEVLDGVKPDDEIKIWSPVEKVEKEEEE